MPVSIRFFVFIYTFLSYIYDGFRNTFQYHQCGKAAFFAIPSLFSRPPPEVDYDKSYDKTGRREFVNLAFL